jgi:ribonuclease-3
MEQNILVLEQVLDYQFQDHELVRRALTHASLVDSRLQSNERLEFLGDAVLGQVVFRYQYEN